MFVDIAAMAACDHRDNEDVVVESVKDAVVPNANTDARLPLGRSGARRPWFLTQKCDRTTNAVEIPSIDSLQRMNCGGMQLDLAGHVRPRSAFTWAQGILGPAWAIASSNAATSSASSSASSISS